ncbi:MAG: DNA methyltransferase [Ignavibacteria bacterium]|nr:DNA methyltransferase [Ignavibacteria bacterium]
MEKLFETEDKVEKKIINNSKTINGSVNELEPEKWREYEEKLNLQFFTIWDTPERDPYNWTKNTIHGNSPVEIPRQCLFRFTKQGDLVLDPFCGSGTTLVVSAHLKRRAIGIEINPRIVEIAKSNLESQKLEFGDDELKYWFDQQKIIIGDSTKLMEFGFQKESFDFCFAHPPYWELVKYSQEYGNAPGDLSEETSLESFLDKLKLVFSGVFELLKTGKFFCVLIGEDFKKGGKTIPLDFYATKIGMDTGFEFYAKIIKVTRFATSRQGKININKYRALRSNYFICNHDYVLIFKKS